MADVSEKLEQIAAMIEDGKYFTITRPRQYGKTTMLYLLFKHFQKKETTYLPIKISFEALGDDSFQTEQRFSRDFLILLQESAALVNIALSQHIETLISEDINFAALSFIITKIVKKANKKVIFVNR